MGILVCYQPQEFRDRNLCVSLKHLCPYRVAPSSSVPQSDHRHINHISERKRRGEECKTTMLLITGVFFFFLLLLTASS